MDRDDIENREIYVHDTQVSKREIEIAEENLHVKEIISDGSSILLHKLRNAAFDGALIPYKVGFLRKDITNLTIYRILIHMLINVADFRTTDKDEKKEVLRTASNRQTAMNMPILLQWLRIIMRQSI